jgi:predicted aspartyl protease
MSEYGGESTISGVSGHLVSTALSPSMAVQLLLGDDGELRLVREFVMGTTRVAKYGNWKEVGSRKLPMRIEQTENGMTIIREWTDLRVKPETDQESLKRPEARESGWLGTGAGKEEIQVTLTASGYYCIPTIINGKEARAIIDTGQAETIIDSAMAKQLDLRSMESTPTIGLLNDIKSMKSAGRVTIGIGNAHLTVCASIQDLEPLVGRQDGQVNVLLGNQLLHAFLVEFSQGGRCVTLWPEGPFELPPNARTDYLASSPQGHPIILGSIGRSAPEWFIIDTGCPYELCLTEPFAINHGIIRGSEATIAKEGGGATAPLPIHGCVTSIDFAGSRHYYAGTVTTRGALGFLACTEYGGIIGGPLAFSKGHIAFDFARHRVVAWQSGR